MAEEIKNLIEKIKREGVEAAEKRALAIETETKKQAQAMLDKAANEAGKIISAAKREAQSLKDSGEAALVQAGRDTLIALKREIGEMLDKVAARNVGTALGGECLVNIIKDLISKEISGENAQIILTLKKEDVERIEKPLFQDLSDQMRKGIVLKSADEIRGGFLISYDGGKSHYDFTQDALAKYIAMALKPRLGEILNKAAKS